MHGVIPPQCADGTTALANPRKSHGLQERSWHVVKQIISHISFNPAVAPKNSSIHISNKLINK